MNLFPTLKSSCVFVEFGPRTLRVLDGDEGLELPVERSELGRLTPLCLEQLAEGLRRFASERGWASRPSPQPAACAVEARGVSIRRLTVPIAPKDELHHLLRLQIEREFPVPPAELAWGFHVLPQDNLARIGTRPAQEVLVVALRKELLTDYHQLLSRCGLQPVFTLAALARNALCPDPPDSYALLDLDHTHAELLSVERGCPASVRILLQSTPPLTRSSEVSVSATNPQADAIDPAGDALTLSPPGVETATASATSHELEVYASEPPSATAPSLPQSGIGQRLYLTGPLPDPKALLPGIAELIRGGVPCDLIPCPAGTGRSAAVLGLRKLWEDYRGSLPVVLQTNGVKDSQTSTSRSHPWKWAAAALLLALLSLALRQAEAVLQTPRLSRKLAELKTTLQQLPNLDRDLQFLRYLKTNQPPYLISLAALAEGAPPGTRIESLSLNRRGDLSLRASLGGAQQVVEFRSKLAASGLFSMVVVDEQTPSPDRQKIGVRITGQWKQTREEPAPQPSGDPRKPPAQGTDRPVATAPAHSTGSGRAPDVPAPAAVPTAPAAHSAAAPDPNPPATGSRQEGK